MAICGSRTSELRTKLRRLDPKTGEMQDFSVPNVGTAAIHSAVPGAGRLRLVG